MIKEVTSLKSKIKQIKTENHQRLHRFHVVAIGEIEINCHGQRRQHKYYVNEYQIFQILHDNYLKIRRCGRNRMKKELNLRNKNITRKMIAIYLNLYGNCIKTWYQLFCPIGDKHYK